MATPISQEKLMLCPNILDQTAIPIFQLWDVHNLHIHHVNLQSALHTFSFTESA